MKNRVGNVENPVAIAGFFGYNKKVNEKKTIDSFEQEGSQMGNPRLYLGAYELHLNLGALTAEGDAAAGDWSLHIERADIHPETFLRQQDALKKIKDRIDD